jgi:hypothetical protein
MHYWIAWAANELQLKADLIDIICMSFDDSLAEFCLINRRAKSKEGLLTGDSRDLLHRFHNPGLLARCQIEPKQSDH